MNLFAEIKRCLFTENPITSIMLGLCPTLAVTTSVENGVGMGLATTFVLAGSNVVISLLKDIIPNKVRIPAYIIVIATFVTVVDLILQAYFFSLSKTLGIFIPLIVVNCIILGRAEAYANKNTLLPSLVDGIFMGLGFSMSLIILASVREILGSGAWFGMPLFPETWRTILVFVLAPGAFITLGFMLVVMAKVNKLIGGK